jgi:carboxymethylenebutenolidase
MQLVTDTVSLVTPDGRMPAYQCRPASGSHPAVLVIMEAFGLNTHIKAVAERIAREGYVTLAPDLYVRFGSPVVPYDDVKQAIGYMKQLDADQVMGDVGVALAHLKVQPFVRPDRIGIVGFCMGGTVALRTACRFPADIRASIPFYGGYPALRELGRLAAPVLALFGETDALIPQAHVKELEGTLRRLGKTAEVVVYPGAGHGFFCDERGSYHETAARDAWTRTQDWLQKYLKD